MKALVDKEWCGCLLFLLQVWSSPSEYHYNCNSFSLVALSLIAANFLSIKASKCSKCGASQCTHSVHGYFPWKLFLGLNLKAPFFFLAFPFRVDQPQIHDLWLLQTRNATPLELYWLPSPTCLWWRCLPKCFNCHLQKWEIWHIFYSFLSRVSRVMAPKMTTSYILGPVCNVGNRRKRN